MFRKKFQVMVPFDEIMCKKDADFLKSLGVKICDLRCSDIKQDSKIIGKVYIMVCAGYKNQINTIRKIFNNKMIYEGLDLYY